MGNPSKGGKGRRKGKGAKKDKDVEMVDVEEDVEMEASGSSRGKGKGKGRGDKKRARDDENVSTPTAKRAEKAQQNGGKFESRTTDTTKAFLTGAKFADLQISKSAKRALAEVMQYTTMTKVQEATLAVALTGKDVLAKAKTGTGKTLAFLIPTVENIMKDTKGKQDKNTIGALAISPTRELAAQIGEEAKALTTFQTGFKTLVVYGGTNIKADIRELKYKTDLLVATPGRLYDHLQNTSGFHDKMTGLKTLILDEADQLLEMGFRDDITRIISYLPKGRQSLLFSATVPAMVKTVAHIALNDKYEFVDCVGDADEQTVSRAAQFKLEVETTDLLPTLLGCLEHARKECPRDFKVIVFFVTARQTGFMSEAVNALKPPGGQKGFLVHEIHSRKSQAVRDKATKSFRECASGVMFSSDVTARGMDFPNITHVFQVGAPASREQYIHRLGRTARAGTVGKGCLIMHPWENYFYKDVKDLPIKNFPGGAPECPYQWETVERAIKKVGKATRIQCYAAWLGYYNGLCPKRIKWDKATLVAEANDYASEVLLLEEQPALLAKTIGKMGLKGVPGLLIEKKGAGRGDGKGGGKGKGGRDRDDYDSYGGGKSNGKGKGKSRNDYDGWESYGNDGGFRIRSDSYGGKSADKGKGKGKGKGKRR